MRLIKLAVPAVVFFTLLACSEPTIDGSSDEAVETSLEQMTEGMSEQEHSEFAEAIMALAFGDSDLLSAAIQADSPKVFSASMRARLDGKTADQVISEYADLRAEREAREREQARQEMSELRQRQEQSQLDRSQMEAFQVLRSRFYMREARYGSDQPIMELRVRNDTDHAISRAYFQGTIASPGRSVPWIEETFNYSIPGGLEPGEQAEWNLAPNRFSDWGKVNVPADAVFTVVPYRLDGADGDALFDSGAFSERDEHRLQHLESRFGE